jgi:linoleoyl-CoA desaturase
METYKYKFSNDKDGDFSRILRSRVNNYFKSNNIGMHANANMIIKSTFMLTLYFAPLILMLSGVVHGTWLILLMWVLMGFGKGGVGMGVMHDANHGAYSRNATVNRFLSYTMNLIGANASVWNYQHNVLHHIYTNIDGSDEDILPPSFLRFSPYQKRYWFHRFQHIYVWFMYSLTTISWVSSRNYVQVLKFRKMGLIQSNKQLTKEIIQISLWKIIYFGYILVLPIILMPVSPWLIISGFIIMHLITGLTLSIIFQTAHVMPSTEFPLPNKEHIIDNNWTVHQLETTTNYGPKSRIFSWLIGGLDHQIEHHLFSNICHIHYKKLSKIVSETAQEFNIRYNVQKNFFHAVWNHTKMMKRLGVMEQVNMN